MKFTIIEAEQRSPEWFLARAGRLTGSRADCVQAKGKGGAESITRRDYRIQLACERLTGVPAEGGYMSGEMQRGIDLEPLAFAAYEMKTGNMVRRTGFLQCDEVMAGCSLDGDVDNFTGILELKCPKTNTHVGYWRNPASFGEAYKAQIQHNMMVTRADWCDLVSFDDRLPKPLQLLVIRIMALDACVSDYEAAALQFLSEVDAETRALEALARGAAAS
jgi:hypothetical protein